MTNLWNQPGIPHKGWRCVATWDLRFEQGDDYTPEVCKMCGQENLRYVHVMEHDDYEPRLRVGSVCAGKMEGDYANPKHRETKLANRLGRRGRWLSRNWRTSRKGNTFLNVEGHNVVVYPDKSSPGWWRYGITDEDDRTVFSTRSYEGEDGAKLAAFDQLAALLDW